MTPRILRNSCRSLFPLLPAAWLLGCASTGQPPAAPPILAEVISVPEGIEMAYRGKVLGKAPLEVHLEGLDQVVELATTAEEPPIIERRIKILEPERVQILIRLGTAPSDVAQALGLTKVVVFDYGALTTFDVDKYELKPELLPMLRQQAEMLNEEFSELDIYVCGHTDSTGGSDHNQILSVNRAQAVADFLADQGLPATRMRVQGFGADYPIAENSTEDGRQLNRRTEIILPGS